MSFHASLLRRLWQPWNPLFWLMVVFNLLSSAMTTVLWALPADSGLRGWLAALALLNTFAGGWLLARLWRGPAPVSGDKHVQGPVDHDGR